MRITKTLYYLTTIFLICIVGCSSKNNPPTTSQKLQTSTIKYAKGFEIEAYKEYKKLIIKSPYLSSNNQTVFYLYPKNSIISNDTEKSIIRTPISKIVATSTTHIPMLELLQEEISLIGFPSLSYISSKKTRDLIDKGKIHEIGNENSLNTEVLLNLQPEIVVGYSINSIQKTYKILQKNGIPVIQNGDWQEETPLGRAEWIKFFGVLFEKEKEADSIFNYIESSYLNAKKIATNTNNKPTILSGVMMNKNTWNLPAGKSFVATFFKDAHLNYLWKDTEGKGSLSVSFESVYEKGVTADFWISPGYFSTKNELLQSNPLYANFDSYKNNTIYTPTLKKGETGGVLFYEVAPTRPDLVLKDLIKITQPTLLPNYEMSFFKQMK